MKIADLDPKVQDVVRASMKLLTKEACAKGADSLRRAANIMEAIPDAAEDERFELLMEVGEAIDGATTACNPGGK